MERGISVKIGSLVSPSAPCPTVCRVGQGGWPYFLSQAPPTPPLRVESAAPALRTFHLRDLRKQLSVINTGCWKRDRSWEVLRGSLGERQQVT